MKNRFKNGFFDIKSLIEEEWEGMPEFFQKKIEPFHSILLHFKNEEDLNVFCKLIKQKITPKTKYIYFPKQKNLKMKNYVYIDENIENKQDIQEIKDTEEIENSNES